MEVKFGKVKNSNLFSSSASANPSDIDEERFSDDNIFAKHAKRH